MKLYFDSGIIYPIFERQIKDLTAPKISRHLYNIRDRFDYFVSNLTKAEIFRRLHNELGVDSKDCYALWETFRRSLFVTEILIEDDEQKISFESIAKMVSERPAPRGIIINLIHLLVAKNNNLFILTSDNVLKRRFQAY